MIAAQTIKEMFSYETKVAAILNRKKAEPPNINGLNLISNPDVVVAMPPINNKKDGGTISSFIQRNISTKNAPIRNPPQVFYMAFQIIVNLPVPVYFTKHCKQDDKSNNC